MWLEYNKELFGHDSIETNYGFICYSIKHPFLMIQELYVKKEFRHQGKARELIELTIPVARKNNCTSVWAQVWVSSLGGSDILRIAFTFGFKMIEAHNNRITIVKDISEPQGSVEGCNG